MKIDMLRLTKYPFKFKVLYSSLLPFPRETGKIGLITIDELWVMVPYNNRTQKTAGNRVFSVHKKFSEIRFLFVLKRGY